MSLANIAAAATEQLVAKYLRRFLTALLIALFALIALYHFTVAGILALEHQFGALDARLIAAGIYTTLTLVSFAAFWAIGPRTVPAETDTTPGSRVMQLAALIEAATLGYELSRKGQKAS
jgi:hypothetical protein